MEDQGVQSPQTFLVENFSNLQPQRKHDDRCASKWVLNTDRGLNSSFLDSRKQNGNVHYCFIGTAGNATVDKMTAKVVEKLEPFALAWRIVQHAAKHVLALRNVEHFFAFKYVSSPQLEWKLFLLNFLSHFFYLVPCIWEFQVFKVNSNLHAGFLHI